MTVVVFGSIFMDLVVSTHRFPKPGETLHGMEFFTDPGGKGANQAAASSRLGSKTWMIGRVGNDAYGESLINALNQAGVCSDSIVKDDHKSSGTALIMVDDSGENEIIIVSGATGEVGDVDLKRLNDILPSEAILLLQLEIPIDTVVKAAELAKSRNALVILDPAPASVLPDELYHLTDWITPNESEAAQLVGFKIKDSATAQKAANVLHQKGVPNVVIKMGSRGAFWSNGQEGIMLPAFKVKAEDTVAAGDAFNGALAAGLDQGLLAIQALRNACAAGGLSTTRAGALQSMPTRSELETLLQTQE